MKNYRLKISAKQGIAAVCCMVIHTTAFAANSSSAKLPFETTLEILKNAICGPFLLSAACIMCVTSFLMMAFAEWGDGFKKIINMSMWLSGAFGVTGLLGNLFVQGATF